ncbi:unnamed protein product [Mytilus edulis]|uniref:Uncharacterized protein n=1 Tax=Mytilus edulis TaxID=6550 RepID=A0A8S3S303_MYTED|nr:unnamed protein product [Mytilus edulis]
MHGSVEDDQGTAEDRKKITNKKHPGHLGSNNTRISNAFRQKDRCMEVHPGHLGSNNTRISNAFRQKDRCMEVHPGHLGSNNTRISNAFRQKDRCMEVHPKHLGSNNTRISNAFRQKDRCMEVLKMAKEQLKTEKNNRSEVINIMHLHTDMDNWPDENGTQLQNMNVSDLLLINDYLKEELHLTRNTMGDNIEKYQFDDDAWELMVEQLKRGKGKEEEEKGNFSFHIKQTKENKKLFYWGWNKNKPATTHCQNEQKMRKCFKLQ